MGKPLLTGIAGMPRAACAAAITAGAAAAALSGCAVPSDYVKPTATVAAGAFEVAPERPAGAAGTAENPVPVGTPAAQD
jgi:hypothetical protein